MNTQAGIPVGQQRPDLDFEQAERDQVAAGGRSRTPLWKTPRVYVGALIAFVALLVLVILQVGGVWGRGGDSGFFLWLYLILCALVISGGAASVAGLVLLRRRLPAGSDGSIVDEPLPVEEHAGPVAVAPGVGLPEEPRAVAPPAADGAVPYKPAVAPMWNNWITLFGLFVVSTSALALLTFGLFSLVSPSHNPYVDIVGYLILPGLLIAGLAAVPLGILFKSWRVRRHHPDQRLVFRMPRIDLNDPVQRRAAKYFLALIFVTLPIVAVSGYSGYHYTDSASFCAEACHSVMAPQATTYRHSAHARVPCAECHIGSGASWFVRSKLSGTRQVLAVWRDSFSRPIPPAITELRPARETCEHCHWPQKFFGSQMREIILFRSDEQNTRLQVDMLLNTGGGGGDDPVGRRRIQGIHKHVDPALKIEYVAVDDKLQEIPWVKVTDAAGNEAIYRSDGRPSSDPRPAGIVRGMDCMDCHNRPAHKFRSPQEAVDLSLELGWIDATLPYIRREAVALLSRPHPDRETAEAQIGLSIIEFYRTQYPDLWEERRASVYQAIDGIRRIYRRNFFPDMNVDWRTYPDNIGHLISPGCFRCHDGSHVNQHGEKISHACNTCHTFLNPILSTGATSIVERGEFKHPMQLLGPHKKLRCSLCHTGGESPVDSCADCHERQEGFFGAKLKAFARFDLKPGPMYGTVECEGCHDLSEPLTVEHVRTQCLDCHDDDEKDYGETLVTWLADLGAARGRAEAAIGALEA
ncbi:MAG: NapC/NirT family cytochrome c, partial [Phycisphaerae bacterium]